MSGQRTERYEVIVIGGGQAGLAVGYYLARAGVPFVILDQHPRVGDVWRRRWDSLRLFTPARYNRLPGMRFPAPAGSYPTKDQMADFLEVYAERFDLPVRTGIRVEGVRRDGTGFVVLSDAGRWTADNVVVATGGYDAPNIPSFAGDLDASIVQLHSSEYRRPSQLADGGTLVVGAANSGAEICLESARDHRTWLSGRDPGEEPVSASGTVTDRLLTPLIWFAATRVLKVSNPIGRKVRHHFLDPPRGVPLARVRRREIAEAGVERVPRTVGVEGGAPKLEDGRVLDVRNVVWCTGFRPDFSWIDLPLDGPYGMPPHERGVVPSEPGLYFMGLFFQYSLSSALVGGAGRDARYIARRITANRASRSEGPVPSTTPADPSPSAAGTTAA